MTTWGGGLVVCGFLDLGFMDPSNVCKVKFVSKLLS